MEIFRLFGSIFVDSSEADRSLSSTEERAEGLSQRLGTIGKYAATAGAVISTAAIAGGTALFGMANSASETASNIADTSAKIGMSTKGFQEWKYVLSQAGVDVEVLQGGFKKFSGVIDDAANGNKKQSDMFKELGVSLVDTQGKVKSTEDIFNEAIIAFNNMEAGAHKSALASDLFGKSSTEMGAILNGTSANLIEAKNRANELGLVLSDNAINAGDQFGDTMDNVKLALGAVFTSIGVEVMPTFQKLLDWIIANMPVIKETVKGVFDTIKNSIELAKNEVQYITDKFIQYWNVLKPILAGIGAGALVFGVYSLAINASAIATTVWTSVTTIATTVGSAFGVVITFLTGPIGILILAISALVAVGVAIYDNWDAIKSKGLELYNWLNNTFRLIFDYIKDTFVSAIAITSNVISTAWNSIKNDVLLPVYNWLNGIFMPIFDLIKTAVTLSWDGLADIVYGVWNSIATNIKSGINIVIDLVNSFITEINSIKIKIPEVSIPGIGKIGGKTLGFSLDEIPALAEGGNIVSGGRVLVGEYAPEILDLPTGARVTPLSKASGGNINITITGNTLMNDRDADKFGELIVRRLKALGVR